MARFDFPAAARVEIPLPRRLERAWIFREDRRPEPVIYRFESFELDTDRYELRREGKPVAVEPQVFAVLTMLVENRDRMLPREEIIEAVWAGRAVSDSVLSSRIKSARHALGDDGDAQRLIRTVHGQGFRFVGEVVCVP